MLIGKLIGQLDHFIDQQNYNYDLKSKINKQQITE